MFVIFFISLPCHKPENILSHLILSYLTYSTRPGKWPLQACEVGEKSLNNCEVKFLLELCRITCKSSKQTFHTDSSIRYPKRFILLNYWRRVHLIFSVPFRCCRDLYRDFTDRLWQNGHIFSPDHRNAANFQETCKTKIISRYSKDRAFWPGQFSDFVRRIEFNSF